MGSVFRTVLLALLGLAFAAFGLVQAAGVYPGPEALGRFSDALPTLATALSFAFVAAAIVLGLVVLVRSAIRLMRRAGDGQIASAPSERVDNGRPRSVRQVPPGHDAPDESPEEYQDDPPYAEADGRHPGEPGGRSRRSGEFDERRRRRASVHR